MEGYDNTTYGEGFADVYDDWYADISDVAATVDFLAQFAVRTAPAPVVELGVGTGRIALPLTQRIPDLAVWGIDSSPAMLSRLRAKAAPSGFDVHAVLADIVDGMSTVCPGERIGIVFVAFNTFFNLSTATAQQRCFDVVARRLVVGGCFVIEAFVPAEPPRDGDNIEVKSMDAGRVVLSIARHAGAHVDGQFVELTEAGGVRLRPWSICYSTPRELDAMGAAAGLVLRERWETFAGDVFDDDSPRHVSVYERV